MAKSTSSDNDEIEFQLMQYETGGLSRLQAIKQAIKDGRLMRLENGSLALMKPTTKRSLLAL